MKLIFWYIFRALAWFSLWNIIDFIEFLKSMLCRFKRGSQRAGPSDQPSASALFLAQSLIVLAHCRITQHLRDAHGDPVNFPEILHAIGVKDFRLIHGILQSY